MPTWRERLCPPEITPQSSQGGDETDRLGSQGPPVLSAGSPHAEAYSHSVSRRGGYATGSSPQGSEENVWGALDLHEESPKSDSPGEQPVPPEVDAELLHEVANDAVLPESLVENEEVDEESEGDDDCPVWAQERGVFQFLNPMKLSGYMMRIGSVRLDQRAYNLLRIHTQVLTGLGNAEKLREMRWQVMHPENEDAPEQPLHEMQLRRGVRMYPSVTTILRGVKDMLKSLTPPMKFIFTAIDISKAGGRSVARRSAKRLKTASDLHPALTETDSPPENITRVGFGLPSAITMEDALVKSVLDAKISTSRGISKRGDECIDDNLAVHGRDVFYAREPGMDAIDPLKEEWLQAVLHFPGSDGSWQWTQALVGRHVLVHFDETLLPEVLGQTEVCDACRPVVFNEESPNGFCFKKEDAIALTQESSVKGQAAFGILRSIWTVQGTASWKDVNLNVREKAQTESSSVRRLSQYLSLASLPGAVSATEPPKKKKTKKNAKRSRLDLEHETSALLPWSPLKPGDTVAMVSLPEVSKRQCLCGTFSWSSTSYLVLVSRWWATHGEVTQQAIFVRNIDSVIKNIEANAGDNSRLQMCPFGAFPRAEGGFSTVFMSPLRRQEHGLNPVAARMRLFAIRSGANGENECPASPLTPGSEGEGSGVSAYDTIRNRLETKVRNAASTYGILRYNDDGDHDYYFVERIYLYHDGFHDKLKRPDSVNGVYMGSLNLPMARRRCAAHIRILSLCPPGTDVKAVYSVILDDILESAINGVDCITSDGKRLKVFIDLMFILADTPAATELLDVPGHTAKYPCHLCNYSLPSEVGSGRGKGKHAAAKARYGSRYTRLDSWGSLVANSRSIFVHQAIRSSGASAEELKRCGILPIPNGEVDDHSHGNTLESEVPENSDGNAVVSSVLPLHDFASKYMKAARDGRLPRDHEGKPLLPHTFCPYKCLPPVPDHLFHNMFKYALVLALKMLHSKRDAKAVELYMQMYQSMCGIVVQSQIVDVDNRDLLNMSMTEVYALSIVADRALTAVADSTARKAFTTQKDERELRKAIRLVASAARIIAFFWTKPHILQELYGTEDSVEFERLVQGHLFMIQELCQSTQVLPNTGPDVCENGGGTEQGGPNQNRNESSIDDQPENAESDARWDPDGTARSYIDKPYCHRLLELAKVFYPIIGHGSLLGELACETKHQQNKRALEGFVGNSEPHVLAMETAFLDDYKARVSNLYEIAKSFLIGTPEGDGAIRGLVRYFFGKLALFRMPADVSHQTRLKVLNVLGVDAISSVILRDTWRPLMSGMDRPGVKKVTSAPQWKVPHMSQQVVLQGCGLGKAVEDLVKSYEREERDVPMEVCQWLGSVVRCNSDGPVAEQTSSGMHEFMRQVRIGSVVTCRVIVANGEEQQPLQTSSPFLPVASQVLQTQKAASEGHESLDEADVRNSQSYQFQMRYFCVLSLYTAQQRDRVSENETGQGYAVRAVVSPVVDAETKTVITRNAEALYRRSRALHTSGDFDIMSEGLSPCSILDLDGSNATIKSVAVLPCCEKSKGCGVYTDESDMDSEIVHGQPTHGPACGPEKGGEFFIRDEATGYPHRSA